MASYSTRLELDAVGEGSRQSHERALAFNTYPAPIHNVPPEILLESFSNLLNDDSRNMIFPSHVCRRWRKLIVRTSSLWSFISLGNRAAEESYLKTIVQRADGRPLSLSINRKYRSIILPTVLEVAGKSEWASLSFKTPDLSESVPLFNGSFNVSKVTHLYLASPEYFYMDFPDGIIDALSFPRLRSLNLDFPHKGFSTSKVSIRWAQLTDLTLTCDIYSTDCISILSQCVILEHCALSPNTDEDNYYIKRLTDSEQSVRLMKLKKLCIKSNEVPTFIPWALDCPVLEEVYIDCEWPEEYESGEHLLSFVGRCGKTLLKLRLPGILTDNFHLALPALQVLEELTIFGPLGWQEKYEDEEPKRWSPARRIHWFFTELVIRPFYLPCLKILRLLDQLPEYRAETEDYIIQFVDSRPSDSDGISPLQRVIFRLNPYASQEQKEREEKFTKWRTQGLQVDIE